MKIKSLYIHIPFCLGKCNYCDFNSQALNTFNGRLSDYLDCLKKELDLIGNQFFLKDVITVYLGGGTPTILSVVQLQNLMEHVYKRISFGKLEEITIEANPGTLTNNKLLALKEIGFNRLSLGAQSFNNELLKDMGRLYDVNDIEQAFIMAREARIENINLDLIYGLPNQTLNIWKTTLKKALQLRPEHIAVYGLTLEETTPWGKRFLQGELLLPDEEQVFEMYKYNQNKLQAAGFIHYEISNFCLKGKESKHNCTYWENEYYLGIGLGAGSYFYGNRYYNLTNIMEYMNTVKRGVRPLMETLILSQKEEMSETVFMGLRLRRGVSVAEFIRRFAVSPFCVYSEQIDKLVTLGLLQADKTSLRLTPKGLPIANVVFQEFI